MTEADIRTVDDPRFADETDALLARLGNQEGGIAYGDLVVSRVSPPDPELAGAPDSRARQLDLYLPLRGGPRRVRLYRTGDRQPILLWCTAAASSAERSPTSTPFVPASPYARR